MHSNNADVYLNFVNGQWKQGNAPDWDENRNPARPNDILGRSTRSIPTDVAKAIDAAVAAQMAWAKRSRPQRAAVLEKVASLIKNRTEQFAKTITLEQGKNLTEARAEVIKAIATLEYVAAESRRSAGEILPSEVPQTTVSTIRVPLGVVGVITTWTAPLVLPVSKIAPALLEGNAVVFKPSTLTPAIAKLLVFTFEEAGIPAGVLTLIYGPGVTTGQAILTDSRIKAVAFAGSVETARQVSMVAARRLARTSLETGGKNSMIVTQGADLDRAASVAIAGAFSGAGQRGLAISRVLVDRSVHQAFVEKLIAGTRQLKLNDGMLDPVAMGPIVDEKRYKLVFKSIETARAEGAKLACGGEPATAPGGGRYITPTIFDDVAPTMTVAREDAMGPVLAVIPVDGFERALEAVALVDVPAAAVLVHASDASVVMKNLDRVVGGFVSVNSASIGPEVHAPIGGIKAALEFFSEVKTVHVGH